jgi:hypothetical protein
MIPSSIAAIIAFILILIPFSVEASRNSWRFDAYSRNIDIDICVKCTSTVPGPQGLPGPEGSQRGETYREIETVPGPQGLPGPEGSQRGETYREIEKKAGRRHYRLSVTKYPTSFYPVYNIFTLVYSSYSNPNLDVKKAT